MNDKEKVFRSRVLPRRLTRAELKALNLESGIVYVKSCKKHGESAKNLEKKLNTLRIGHVKKSEEKKNQRTRQSIEQGSGSLQRSCKLAEKHVKKHARKERYYTEIDYPIRSQFNKRMNTVHRKLAKLTELNKQILHRTEANTAVIKAATNEAEKTFLKAWEAGGPVPAKPSNRVKHLVVLFVTLSVTFFVLFQMVATGQLSQSEREDIQEVISSHNMPQVPQVPQVPPGLQAVTTAGPALLPLLLWYAKFYQQQATSIGGRVPAGVIGAVAKKVRNSDAGLREILGLRSDLGRAWHA